MLLTETGVLQVFTATTGWGVIHRVSDEEVYWQGDPERRLLKPRRGRSPGV